MRSPACADPCAENLAGVVLNACIQHGPAGPVGFTLENFAFATRPQNFRSPKEMTTHD